MAKQVKIPKTLGACADLLYKTRQARLDLQKKVDELAKEEAALREHIINTLPKSEAEGVQGKIARVSIAKKIVPQVKDWEALRKFIKKTDAFDIIQRRVSDVAIRERWDAGKNVPGVEPFTVVNLSLNKV